MRAWMLAASFALAFAAWAGAPLPIAASAQNAAVDLPAGEYRLDPRHASVLFKIQHMRLAWFTARFDSVDATLTLNPSDLTQSRLQASVGADSVNTGVLNNNGERHFDAQIARALGAEANPRITFTSTAIAHTGENTGRVTGELSMNGQTHPATLDVAFYGGRSDTLRGGMALGFSAVGAINRRDWGVDQWAAFTGNDVQIVIEAEFVKD